jgi:glutamate racemase
MQEKSQTALECETAAISIESPAMLSEETAKADAAIGVFDSGIGGLTCVAELQKLMPNEDIIYFGDTARIPYGTRSKETVMRYAAQDIAFIRRQGVKIVIAACGTVSSVAIAQNAQKQLAGEHTLFTGVVIPAAQAAVAATRNKRVGVIGTAATIKTGAYGRAMHSMMSDIRVFGNACPMFVPLVENGYTDRGNIITKMIAEQYLKPLKAEGVDTLILGCTHYPIIEGIIADYMDEGINIISSGREAANAAFTMLTAENLLTARTTPGKTRYYVSDGAEQFAENAHAYLGYELNAKQSTVELIDLDDLCV